MKSGYKRIGNYIRLVDERNRDLSVTRLLGLSIEKVFIASVANIIGSDMANYKIIRKGQFACSLMQVRRDKKIPVALLRDFDEAIISQAYPVFEIIDRNELDPDYLMMWMSRPEFDRHACFLAVGGVRGSLEWEDFCDMELPVPSIEKQREIVREYNTIVNRIQMNEQMNHKLEETAQAIYKHWFVDFEFPISAEYAASIGKPELEGKPYKSSGGEMVFSAECDQEIPKGWRLGTLNEIAKKIFSGGTPSTLEDAYWGPEYFWLSSGETRDKIIVDSERMITQAGVDNSSAKLAHSGDSVIATAGQGKTRRQTALCKVNAYINQSVICIRPKYNIYRSYIFVNLSTRYHELRNESDAQSIRGSLNKDNLSNLPILISTKDLFEMYEALGGELFEKFYLNRKSETALRNTQGILLSKMSVNHNKKEKAAA